jgi:hypothetical protein
MKADIDSLRAALGTVSNISNVLLERALAAATSWTKERVYPDLFDDEETQEAIILLASRWYKRRLSPEGVAGWNDLGVVRVIARDPDIVLLLEHKIDTSKDKVGIS